MAATRFHIYNNALVLARIKPMANEEDRSSAAAYLVQLEFPSQVVMTLREIAWNFAKRTVTLQQVEDRRGVYWKPTDPQFVRLWWEDDQLAPESNPPVFEDGPYLCVSDGLVVSQQRCSYIGLVDIDEWPDHFVNLLALRLGHKISLSHSPPQVQVSLARELHMESEKCMITERSQRARPRPSFTSIGREYSRYGENLYGPNNVNSIYDRRGVFPF